MTRGLAGAWALVLTVALTVGTSHAQDAEDRVPARDAGVLAVDEGVLDVAQEGDRQDPDSAARDQDSVGLNGQWRRAEDLMVLEISGDVGDFLNDERPEWQGSAPTFRDITPIAPGRWTARSQEQRISTGEVFPTSCVLVAVGDQAFIATCQGQYNVYRHQYDRVGGDLTV